MFRLLLVGAAGVGKTSLLRNFLKFEFDENLAQTIGAEFETLSIKLNEEDIKIPAVDVSGQKRFQNMVDSYFSNSQVFFACVDITETEVKQTAKTLIAHIQERCRENTHIILVGTKADQANKKQKEAFEKLGKKLGFVYLITSAKTGENVTELFECAAKLKQDEIITTYKDVLTKYITIQTKRCTDETKQELFHAIQQRIDRCHSLADVKALLPETRRVAAMHRDNCFFYTIKFDWLRHTTSQKNFDTIFDSQGNLKLVPAEIISYLREEKHNEPAGKNEAEMRLL